MEEKNYSKLSTMRPFKTIVYQNDTILYDGNLKELEWLFGTIDRRILPAVTIGGLLLQSLNVVVLLSKQLRNNAIRFLAAMSLADVIFLLIQLPFLPVPFIASDEANASLIAATYYEFIRRFYGRFVLYPTSRVCLATNTWLAVFVSFERYLALRPTHSWTCASRYGISRRKLSLPAIIAAVILAAALNVDCFFENTKAADGNSTADTGAASESGVEALEGVPAVARFAFTYMLPLVLLLVFNTALIYLLVQYRRNQLRVRSAKRHHNANDGGRSGWRFSSLWRSRASGTGESRRLESASESVRCHRHSRSTLSTAVMVLAAVIVHLAFDAPGTALTVLVFFKGQAVVRTNIWLILGSHFSNVLVLVHCSIDWCAICNY